MIVRSNMCRGFPQAVRMDYSGFDVGDGLPDHLADPVDVPGTRPGKDGSPAGGSLSTGSPGSRRPAGGAPGSKRLRRSWPGSPTAPGEPRAGHRGRRLRAGRRDDDAPRGAGLTGTLFQRQLTTARAPPRRGSPTDGASDPGPHPDSPGADAQTDGATDTTADDRTPSRPSPATETSPFSRRRGRQAVFRRIPPALGPLLP